jgi:hypothetical protein
LGEEVCEQQIVGDRRRKEFRKEKQRAWTKEAQNCSSGGRIQPNCLVVCYIVPSTHALENYM